MPKSEKKAARNKKVASNDASRDQVVEAMGSAMFAEKQRAIVSGLIDYSDALNAATVKLEGSDRAREARVTQAVTDLFRSSADTLATTGPDEALDKVRAFARDNPTLFTCGAAAAGAAFVLWATSDFSGETETEPAANDTEAA